MLTGGKHVAKVLVLYPLSSIWANYVPQAREAVGNVIEFDFNYLTDTLLRLHFDFDFVDEDVLAEAMIHKGKITIRDEEYSILILPPVTHMKRSTFKAIKKFYASGGNLIADTLLPVEFLETDKSDAAKDVTSLFGVDPKAILSAFRQNEKTKFSIIQRKGKGKLFFFTGKGLHRARPKKQIARLLRQCVPPDVTISDEAIFYLHRVKDERDIYFFVNTCQQPRSDVEISFEQVARPELWDPNTGEIKPLHVFRVNGGRLVVRLDFPATEARVVVLNGAITEPFITETNVDVLQFDGKELTGSSGHSKEIAVRVSTPKGTKLVRTAAKKPLKPLSLGTPFTFTTEHDNVLSLSRWKMLVDDGTGFDRNVYRPEFDDHSWLDVTNGAWELQLDCERENATYPVGLWYRTSFNIDTLPPNTRLLIDGFSGSEHRLFVNGNEITEKGRRSALDAEIKEVNIQPFIKIGKNIVAVALTVNRRTDGILDLLKIVGNFALRHDRDSDVIVATPRTLTVGDWTKQGYPFYSGTGVYHRELEIAEPYLNGRLFLEVDCGDDVLEVSVNNGPTTVVPWHPYRVEITGMVHVGKNTVQLKVTNTLINALEAVQKPSGIFSVPTVRHHHLYTLAVGN